MKKYKILEDGSIKFRGKSLCRIQALIDFADVKAGDIGGYVESENGDKIEIILKSQPKRWESILPYEAKFVSVYLSNKNIHVATLNKKWFSKYSNIFKKQNGQGFLQRIFRKSKT